MNKLSPSALYAVGVILDCRHSENEKFYQFIINENELKN